MSRFTDNVNKYMSAKKIKNSFIIMKTGIDESKLSLILKDKQKVTEEEMTSISNALGHDLVFFGQEKISIPAESDYYGDVAFYCEDNPSKYQAMTANKLIQFAKNIDNIICAKTAFYGAIRGGFDGIEDILL